MRLLSVSAAAHFCTLPPLAPPREDVETVAARNAGRRLTEGGAEYEAYRHNVLREGERLYYLALSNFRRAHVLMVPSAAAWSHVTLYYSSWFAAHALLQMFGGWVGKTRTVDIVTEAPGAQVLRVAAKNNSQGSHKSFWTLFYSSVRPIKAAADVQWHPALEPVSSNEFWLIQARNRVNYTVRSAEAARGSFVRFFDAARFPASLSGELATQFEIARCMLGVAAQFLRELGVTSDEFVTRDSELASEIWDVAVQDVISVGDRALFVV
jgi:hypothetical protein